MFRRKAGFSQHFGKAASLWAEAWGCGWSWALDGQARGVFS